MLHLARITRLRAATTAASWAASAESKVPSSSSLRQGLYSRGSDSRFPCCTTQGGNNNNASVSTHSSWQVRLASSSAAPQETAASLASEAVGSVTDASQSASSDLGTASSTAHTSDETNSKDTKGHNRAQASSHRSRKRLARLSARLAASVQERPTNDGRPSIAKPVWHPSRPRNIERVKDRARRRWEQARAKAADEGSVEAMRARLEKMSETPRPLRNLRRLEASEQDKAKASLKFSRHALQGQAHEQNLSLPSEGEERAGDKGAVSDTVAADPARHRAQRIFEETPGPFGRALEKSSSQPPWSGISGGIEANGREPAEPQKPSSASSKCSRNQSVKQTEKAKGAPLPQTELLKGDIAQQFRSVKPSSSKALGGHSRASNYLPASRIPSKGSDHHAEWNATHKWNTCTGDVLSAADVPLQKVEPLREMKVANLAHGLDRVLFNPSVFWLREPRSAIYNFDPRIRRLYDVDLFDYSALPAYLTSSIDPELAQLAQQHGKKYTGSTSSLTGLLSHIYFCISANKQPELFGFSEGFSTQPKGFSFGARLPASIVLRRFEDTDSHSADGTPKVRYAIDNDKSASGEAENSNYVLTQLGKSVEKLLTSDVDDYEKYLRVNSQTLSKEEKEKKEAYYYSQTSKFLMRSQLDCSDDRLPRKTFDLKTRAVVAVRQDRANWVESSGYMIRRMRGVNESFEREMWDMTRSAFLKYFFQARIGNMDGILVAYHSTATMFGFQYVPLEDMMMQLFSSMEMGEQAFLLCIGMLERVLDVVTDIFPNDTLRITVDTQLGDDPRLTIFAQPDGADPDDPSAEKRLLQFDVQVDRYLSDSLVQGPVDFNAPQGYEIDPAKEDEIARRQRAELPPLKWSVEYAIRPRADLSVAATKENLQRVRSRQAIVAPLTLPNVSAINEREALREATLAENQEALEQYYRDRETGVAMGMPRAPGQVPVGKSAPHARGSASAPHAILPKSSKGGDASSAVHVVSVDDGDVVAAGADLNEKTSAQAPSDLPAPTRWTKQNERQERLRQLARLGREDQDRAEQSDRLQIYEPRGE